MRQHDCGYEITDEQCGHAELVETIRRWSEAYPLRAFPEPDHKATGHDPSLCSASMGRHVIGRLMELIPEDIAGSSQPSQAGEKP